AAGCDGDAGQRARQALAYARRLAGAGAGLFAEHPGLARQLESMATTSPQQLAHEFLSGHWQPLHAGDVIGAFASAGAQWIGSATPIENIDALSVPGQVRALLREAASPALAETVRDAARHQSLRRDLFQRGGGALDASAHLAALDALEWIAAPGAPAGGQRVLDTRIGPVQVPEALSGPLLRRLAQGPASQAELRRLAPFDTRADLLNQVGQALLWDGCVHPRAAVPAEPARIERLCRQLERRTPPRWQPWPQAGSALPQAATSRT
ncbi:MAG: methyltransferase regulatory domain-containing protein, partial [Pseudomonas sp.]